MSDKPNTATITGTVSRIGEDESYGAKGFTKRLLVITPDGDDPQTIGVEWHKANAAKLDALEVGQHVSAEVNVRGREYQGRYYTTLVGWQVFAGARPAAGATYAGGDGSGVDLRKEGV